MPRNGVHPLRAATFWRLAQRMGMSAFGVKADVRWCSANWSVKLEYNFMDFGSERLFFNIIPLAPNLLPFDEDIEQRIHVVKVGLNYRFDWGGR